MIHVHQDCGILGPKVGQTGLGNSVSGVGV